MGRKAFTVIEIIIVLALLMILAAVTSYYYGKYSYQAKRLEAVTNLGHIRQLEEAYRAEENSYVTCDWSPVEVPPPKGTTDWNEDSYFYIIDFRPKGSVRYRYSVAKSIGDLTVEECEADVASCYNSSIVENGFVNARDGLIDFVAKAEGDLDNDGNVGKLFVPDEPSEKITYLNREVF